MSDSHLFRIRIGLVQSFLRRKGYDGILISRIDNFAMATGGKRNYVSLYTDIGASSLFIKKTGEVYFVGNNIESSRMLEEELSDCPITDVLIYRWFQETSAQMVKKFFSGNLVSDDGSVGQNVHGELAPLRAALSPYEWEKYRQLGKLAAEAMQDILNEIEVGMSEAEIAACLVSAGWQRQCHVPVILVAADERIAVYRHPLPPQRNLSFANRVTRGVQRYVMVAAGFLRDGLVVSLTRFKKVREIPAEIEDAYFRICAVDTVLQEATQPNKTLGDVFKICQNAYTQFGFSDDEWHNHHQGGATGYGSRTCKASPGESFPVINFKLSKELKDIISEEVPLGSAFAWNPSAPGVKSEDTFLVFPDGSQEIVTLTTRLPVLDLSAILGRETKVIKSSMAE